MAAVGGLIMSELEIEPLHSHRFLDQANVRQDYLDQENVMGAHFVFFGYPDLFSGSSK